MGRNCYVDAQGCIVCPALPAEPGSPAKTTVSPHLGWNAGANSIATLDGDVTVKFDIEQAPVDTFVGYLYSRLQVGMPPALAYAFRIFSAGSSVYYQVFERGVAKTAAVLYALATPLEIRRVGGRVTYLVNNKPVLTSTTPSMGALVVSSCLFSAGDTIP